MMENIILGAIHGVAEWLPISSEGALLFTKLNFLSGGQSLNSLAVSLLYLQLGAFFAVIIYFRKQILGLLFSMFAFRRDVYQEGMLERIEEKHKTLIFLSIVTVLSSVLGYILLVIIKSLGDSLLITSRYVAMITAVLLFYQAFIYLRNQKRDLELSPLRTGANLRISDAVILGIIQGFAVLPGLSRSGLTMAALLLQGFEAQTAIRLSMLMALPVILARTIILNIDKFTFSPGNGIMLIASYIFSYLTISLIMHITRKISITHFIWAFGILSIIFSFIL